MTDSTVARARVLADGFAFLEGPRWHDGRLWVSDMHGHRVHAVDENGATETITDAPDRVSGLGWLPDGRLLVVAMTDRKILRLEPNGQLVVHADLSSLTQYSLNDMWVDTTGRAYVGEMGLDIEKFLVDEADALSGGPTAIAALNIPPAKLFRVDPDGSVTEVATDLRFPNGTAITPDGRSLLVAETLALRVARFDLADGRLNNRRDIPLEFLPDGMSAVDADGCVWVASPFTSTAARIDPGGRIVESVESDQMVIACALGGRAGNTLFLCTATALGAEESLRLRQSRLETALVHTPVAPARH